jgi:hypothetical protein
MLFLFCQPGLKNKDTVDYLIRSLIIKTLGLKKNYLNFDSFQRNNNRKIYYLLVNFIPKVLHLFLNGLFTFFDLKKLYKKKAITHIFFDSYTIFDLFFFSISNFNQNKTKLFVYLRIPYDQIMLIKFFFFFSINKLKTYNKNNLIFLTDTLELKNHFKRKFDIECKIIPIPSKITNYKNLKKINSKKIDILFPGKSREEKGTSLISSIFENIPGDKKIIFKFLENTYVFDLLKKNKKIKPIMLKKNLSYQKYIKSINDSDILILPYTHKTYKLRSSGIFIDAIKLNKFCFVSNNTWMSSLLKKNGLKIFVLKIWSFEEIYKRIKFINENFYEIQKNYTNFRHNILLLNSEKKFKLTITKLLKNKSK